MNDAAALLVKNSGQIVDVPIYANVLFAIPRSKSSKLLTPVGDGDNYEKAAYDLLQKQGYLLDDRLITTCKWRKRFVPFGVGGYIKILIAPDREEIDI